MLWLGTQDSLISFDGVHFREFDGAPDAAFHRSLVRDLAQDSSGNLWAASIGNGILRVAPNGTSKRYTTENGLPSNDVFCLDTSTPGQVWACTNRGLVRIEGNGSRTFTIADGLPSDSIRGTCVASNGTRWVAGLDFGLARAFGSQFAGYSHPMLPTQGGISALRCAHDGTLWVGTEGGVLHVAGADSRLLTSRDGLPDNSVLSLGESRDGSIWIGTEHGISRFCNGSISVYRTSDGLSHSLVLSLFEDREGSVWAGTKDGLDQFTEGTVTPYTREEGLSSNNVGPLLEDGSGRLWVGTLGDGLNVYENNHFRHLTRASGLLDNTILSLAVDQSGSLWVGTRLGVNRIVHGKVASTFTRSNGLSGEQILALFCDVNGTLWAGTENGLDRFTGTRFVSANSLITGDRIGSVVALSGGQITNLIASTERSTLFTLQDKVATRHSLELLRPVDCFLPDPMHRQVWMGTLGSGLLRYRNGTLSRVRIRDGLYDGRIYGILRDDRSNLWMASSKGIFRVSEQELDSVADGRSQWVTSLPFSTGQLRFECQPGVQPAATRTRDGRLWFSTDNGLVMVDPRHLATNQTPPPARLLQTLVNGKPVIPSNASLHLTPDERNIEIRYAGLSFVSPERVTFRYRLKGYEQNWTDANTRHVATYTNLPPGNFEFQVTARNADGVWSVEPAALSVSVAPRFYQRSWFFPLLILCGCAVVYAGYQFRVARLRRRFSAVLSERSRIARELHDTLLQGLSGITMQLQALWTSMPGSPEKQHLLGIIDDAQRCSREARHSLWGLRTFGSTQTDLAEKLERLARETLPDDGPFLRLHLQPISIRESPEIEYQLLRIIREALANTLAHANARTVDLTLALERGTLCLRVEDDGVGFLTDAKRFGHFGMIGMRERAASIGAVLTISSQPGQGTVVSVSLHLPGVSKLHCQVKQTPICTGDTDAAMPVVHHK